MDYEEFALLVAPGLKSFPTFTFLVQSEIFAENFIKKRAGATAR
jgi:hypothetical protein